MREEFRAAFELRTFRRLSQGYISTSRNLWVTLPREVFGGKRKVRVPGYRNAFSLSVYVLRSISLLSKRLPLRLHYCGTPLCYGNLWPRDMYPEPFALICDGTCVRLTYTDVSTSACADRDEGRAGVCLRVHYVDCWSRPLRRTQRTAKRAVKLGWLKRVESEGTKTAEKRHEERKRDPSFLFPG